MLYREIFRTLSFFTWILLFPLVIPLSLSYYYEYINPAAFPQPPAFFAFLATMGVTGGLALLFAILGRKGSGSLYRKEALLLVIIVYFLTTIIGALPFLFSGTLKNPLDAYFESVSGLTTTGASIMEAKIYDSKTHQELPIVKNFVTGEKSQYSFYGTITPIIDPSTGKTLFTGIEAVNRALLFWRSLLQWLGGGGVIVLLVAILPALGVGGKILYQTEVTGPSKESLVPRIKETASHLWKIYLGLTLLQVIFLLPTSNKMTLFDAFTISFSTLSTGGFSVRNLGIAYYNSAATEYVVMLFMILGSISFSLYFYLMRGKFSRLRDRELRLFLTIIGCSILITIWQLYGKSVELLSAEGLENFTFLSALRYGAFQVISAQTSTGFATANFDLWPFSVQVLMLILMYVGGMAGSTAGGLKIIRHQTFFHILKNKIEMIFRPDTIRLIRIGQNIVENPGAITLLCYFMIAIIMTLFGTFFLVLDGIDPETSVSTLACMINNVGIAFRMGGPEYSFAFLSNFGKILSCFVMIAGRLEFFALFVIFLPTFWRSG